MSSLDLKDILQDFNATWKNVDYPTFYEEYNGTFPDKTLPPLQNVVQSTSGAVKRRVITLKPRKEQDFETPSERMTRVRKEFKMVPEHYSWDTFQDVVIVYRVQRDADDPLSSGPYCSSNSLCLKLNHTDPFRWPTVYQEDFIDHLGNMNRPSGNYCCGFENQAKYINWFGRDLDTLYDANCVLTLWRVPKCDVYRANKQCLFLRSNATLLDTRTVFNEPLGPRYFSYGAAFATIHIRQD